MKITEADDQEEEEEDSEFDNSQKPNGKVQKILIIIITI